MNRLHFFLFGVFLVSNACDVAPAAFDESEETMSADLEPKSDGSGLRIFTSDGTERSYYVKLPKGYGDPTDYPLVIAFHGTGGDYTRYTKNQYYNLHGAIGEDAVIVYPNALAPEGGEPQWNYVSDLSFFDDLVAILKETLSFDHRRLFVVGHSSGAGFAHQIACRRGNVVRAVAPVAGALIDDSECRGEVAVIQIQGITDTMVPPTTAIPGRNYWITYNGCDPGSALDVSPSPCVEYSGCDTGYPVRYCEHDEEDPQRHGGHAWPSFAGEAIWSFFKELAVVEPKDVRGSGADDATLSGVVVPITFTLRYPADFSPPPAHIGLALGPVGSRQPITEFPLHILTSKKIKVEDYDIGGLTEYTLDANVTGVVIPEDYTLGIVIFVKGNTWPMPTFGRDWVGLTDISIKTYDPIVIQTPVDLERIQNPLKP